MASIKQPKNVRVYGGSTKKELNPYMFNGTKLKLNVREALLKIAHKFEEYLEFEQPVINTKLVGSSINYNWTSDSDVDLHLVYDFDSFDHCPDEQTIRDLVLSKKSLFNLKHDIKVFGMDVELYVEDVNDENKSSAVYSLTDNMWIRKPTYTTPDVNKDSIIKKVKYYMNFVDNLEAIVPSQRKLDAMNRLKQQIINVRQKGLMDSGDFDPNNLIFKSLRNHNYLEKLSNMIAETEDTLLSLEKPEDD